ncbi:MAG: acylphosphatase [Acidobacteriota bacterium]|nr:acylphosphatase [Acidobacteriota bacterium]
MQARHIVVHGRVQGVGFRYFTRAVGTGLGLTGTVGNLDDGTVEIVAEGGARALDGFLAEVGRGPARSRVDRLDVSDIPARGAYGAFLIV